MLPKQLENIRYFLKTKVKNPTAQQKELLYELETLSEGLEKLNHDNVKKIIGLEHLVENKVHHVTSAWGGSPDSCPTCGR